MFVGKEGPTLESP